MPSKRKSIPDGYEVRLANGETKHFPTATDVEKTPDGSIRLMVGRVTLDYLKKDAFLDYWPVIKKS